MEMHKRHVGKPTLKPHEDSIAHLVKHLSYVGVKLHVRNKHLG